MKKIICLHVKANIVLMPYFGIRDLLGIIAEILNRKMADELYIISDERECYRMEAIRTVKQYLFYKLVDEKALLPNETEKADIGNFMEYLKKDSKQKCVLVGTRWNWQADKIMDILSKTGVFYCNIKEHGNFNHFFNKGGSKL